MARYPVYKLAPSRQAQLAKAMGMPKKEIVKFCSVENCLRMAARAAGNRSNSSGVQNILTETLWVHDGREAVFIQDEETAQAILNLRVKNFDPTTLEHGSWLFLLPQSLGIPPFIFAVRSFKHWRAAQQSTFSKLNVGLDYGDWEASRQHGETDATVSYALTFYRKDYCFHQSSIIDRLVDCFNGDIADEQVLDGGIYDSGLDAEEKQLVAKMVHFATKALVYQMVFPDKVLDEGPKIATTDMVRPKSKTITPAFSITGGRGPSVIAPFVRQLNDDRFYKGEFAHMRKGTRFSIVRSHVRGTKKFVTLDEDGD